MPLSPRRLLALCIAGPYTLLMLAGNLLTLLDPLAEIPLGLLVNLPLAFPLAELSAWLHLDDLHPRAWILLPALGGILQALLLWRVLWGPFRARR